ncbi:MAG: NnrS family protein [Gammaproteobacteria bacterium]
MHEPEIRPARPQPVFLSLGFRPFFIAAAAFAVLSMLAWMQIYVFARVWPSGGLPAAVWHAHEMIYGYAMAVIAGFLLTAVRNWTGVPTVQGLPLLLLLLLWTAGRILIPGGGDTALASAAVADTLFATLLLIAIARPVIKTRQWRQTGILSKVALLPCANLLFYAGVLGYFPQGVRVGLYSGLYLIVALVLVMARRVLPFFIEKGVGYSVRLTNRRWLDIAGLLVFFLFWIADILQPDSLPASVLAGLLFILHTFRMAGWYTPGIWRHPLLWSLYGGYGFLVLGFALKAAVPVFAVLPLLALHAFAYGGIGLFTLGMMTRVSIAHTGRDILAPRPILSWMFAVLALGAIIRIIPPLVAPAHYMLWIGLSQALWIAAFVAFLFTCLPMLLKPSLGNGRVG